LITFTGGMIDGEERNDIEADIFTVPYYTDEGMLAYQIYNRIHEMVRCEVHGNRLEPTNKFEYYKDVFNRPGGRA
jgi:hypothetical protein